MAESVKPGRRWLAWAAWAMLMLPVAAGAETLPDPTLPPATLAPGGYGPPVTSGPVLQSVLVSPGRKVAVISGQTVGLGAKFGDATVVKITEGEVALRNGNNVQVLTLYPGMEKKSSGAATGSTARPRPQ
jgi:MSHA biogenesis protein MshK